MEVFDVKHLDKVINSIKGVPGVLMWNEWGAVQDQPPGHKGRPR